MGFEVGTRTFRIQLRGSEFDGAEARAESTTVARYIELTNERRAGDKPPDQVIMDAFAEHLLTWNLTIEGEAIPATPEAMQGLDPSLAMSLAAGWLNKVTEVQRDRPFLDQNPVEAVANGQTPPGVEIGSL